jgi:hypothetical protein
MFDGSYGIDINLFEANKLLRFVIPVRMNYTHTKSKMKLIEFLTLKAKFALLNALDSEWIEKQIAKLEVELNNPSQDSKSKISTIKENIDM